MSDIITTLHPENDDSTNLYPNIKKENIPDGSIDTNKLDDYINGLLNNIGELQPSGVDTSTVILAKTSDDGIWVGTDTGHWYYWDGTQYVDGGVYQATQIADDSVTRDMLNDTATSYYLNNITPTTITRNATVTISHNNFDYSLGYQTSDITGYFGLSFKIGNYADIKNGNAIINIKSISVDGVQLLVGKNEGNWTEGTYAWNSIYITKAGIYTIPIKNDNIASDSNNIYVFIKKDFIETSNISGIIDFNIGYAFTPLNDKLNCALLGGKTKDDLMFGNYYNNNFPVIMPSSVIRNSTLRFYGVDGYEYPFKFKKNSGAGYFGFFVNIGTYGTIKNKKLLVDLTSMGNLPIIEILPCSTSYDWSGWYNNINVYNTGKYVISLKKSSREPSDNTTIYLVFRNQVNYENTIVGTIKCKMCFLDDTMQIPNAYTLNGYTSDDFVKNIISTDVICWGDSLTAGAGGNGTTYETVIASLLNCNVLNCGVGGEKAETIALRQGGLKGIIPVGNGTSFNILNPNYNTNSNYSPLKQGQGYINPITIDGNEYTLTKNNDDTYSISGYINTINKPFKTYGSTLKGKVTIIWVGTNNGGISDSVIDVIDNMISICGNDKYIIMGLTSDNETSDNDKLLSHFGTHFFNTRKEIIENWVAISGLTPTSDDNTRTSNNLVPSSLLSDSVHFNAKGYTVIGTLLSYRIKELLDSNGNEYLSAIQNLTGYGWGINDTCCNYIDFETKKFVQKVGRVDLGSVDYDYISDGAYPYFRSSGIISLVKKPADNYTLANIVCSSLEIQKAVDIRNNGYLGVAIDNSGYIRIATSNMGTDTTTLKTAMSGVYLYYELETPIETDISNYIINDTIDV